MEQTLQWQENPTLESLVPFKIAAARLAIGLLQGLVLYGLYAASQHAAWPANHPYLFTPLLLISGIVPIILISSLGHLNYKQTAIWIVAATLIISALGIYDVWRLGGSSNSQIHFPSAMLVVFSIVGFFIAHSFVLAGASEKRRIAHYSRYFEVAWKLFIQLSFSALFVGALWLVLWVGAALFMQVNHPFLQNLIQEAWFEIIVTAFAFCCAKHLTDVRPSIVRGIRMLLLMMLSWILPVATLIIAGFLVSLLGAGLMPLLATGHATSVLIGSAAVLIFLINAAFQNGETAPNAVKAIRISTRIAAVILVPITIIAVYSLGVRVHQYGWTTMRIFAAASLGVIACYAVGYAWAACSRHSRWLEPISTVNIVTAFVILGVLFSLFSPIADPARLSVENQMTRLANGQVPAGKFDFDYLKSEGTRYGLAALHELKAKGYAGADGNE